MEVAILLTDFVMVQFVFKEVYVAR